MYSKSDRILLVTTASAVPNNLAVQKVGKDGKSFAIGVIHGGYINIVPIRECDMRSRYVPCIESGTRPRHVTTTVTQIKWCSVHKEQLLLVTSSLGFQVFDDMGRNCWFTHACLDSTEKAGKFARGIALIGDGTVCVGNNSGTIRVFHISEDFSEFKLVDQLPVHQKCITDLASNQHDLLASADDSGTIVLYDVGNDTRCLAAIQSFGFPCTCLQIWKSFILAAYGSGHIRMFEAKFGSILCEVSAHARWITALDLAPDKGVLLSVSEDSCAKVWGIDKEERRLVHKFSVPCDNGMLMGGRFLNSSGTEFCVTAFDSNEVFCYST
ncbi:WD repeat-containing protein 54 [Anabrus simplex]|uniref:WD repeat-containing protein 54 n=1 Tax=Anabrus simplex TaxID=316456 RepID=UPI0035A3229B